MLPDKFAFNRGAVRPFVCLREGWGLIRDAYALFLGITFLGVLIAGLGPMGMLIGPCMCGIHLCLLRHERWLRVSFDMLFNGFHYFVQSLIAAMFIIVPGIIAFFVAYIGSIICGIVIGANLEEMGRNQHGDTTLPIILACVIAVLVLGFIGFQLLLQVLFFFTFPLIVDREMPGIEALKLSYRAGMANWGGLLGLILLTMLLDLAGLLMCYVGVFLVMPIHYAMVTIAYRQVVPVGEDQFAPPPFESESPLDSPPASIRGGESTGISAAPRDQISL